MELWICLTILQKTIQPILKLARISVKTNPLRFFPRAKRSDFHKIPFFTNYAKMPNIHRNRINPIKTLKDTHLKSSNRKLNHMLKTKCLQDRTASKTAVWRRTQWPIYCYRSTSRSRSYFVLDELRLDLNSRPDFRSGLNTEYYEIHSRSRKKRSYR